MVEEYPNMNLRLDSRVSPGVINILVALTVLVLALAMFTNSMAKPLDPNEQMYCTAGVLLARGKMIYRDFSYTAQMPYHPLFCAALFKALNTTHYLLTVRILSVVCDVLVVTCIIGIYRRVFNCFSTTGPLLGISAAVLYAFNPLVDRTNGCAWNHDAVILCIMLSFWLFISIDFRRKTKYWRIAVIGALLTIATGMRITMALVQLLFFVMLLTQPAESTKQRFKTVMPFLLASAVFSIWPIWTVAAAPRAFFMNIFQLPMIERQLWSKAVVIYGKFELLLLCLTIPGGVLPVLIAACLCVILIRDRHKLTISNPRNLLLAVLLPLALLMLSLTAPVMLGQHMAIFVPFLVVSFVYPLLYIRNLGNSSSFHKHFRIASIVVIACVFAAVGSKSIVLLRIPKLLRPQSWVPIQVHKISLDIARKTKGPKQILTLFPLYALEGGCNIYTELATGQFAYTIVDRLSGADRDITHTVGPKTVRELFEKFPPSAVILELKDRYLEEPIQKAVKNDWSSRIYDKSIWERKEYDGGPVVYFRR